MALRDVVLELFLLHVSLVTLDVVTSEMETIIKGTASR